MFQPLWSSPTERIKATSMYRFMQEVDPSHIKNFTEFNSRYQWSIDTPEAFRAELRPTPAKIIPVPDIPYTFKYLPAPLAGTKTLSKRRHHDDLSATKFWPW